MFSEQVCTAQRAGELQLKGKWGKESCPVLMRGVAWCGGTEYLRVRLQEQTRGADTDERMMKEEGIPSGDHLSHSTVSPTKDS